MNQSHAHCDYESSGRLTMEAPVACADELMADCSPSEPFELPCDDMYKAQHYTESRLEYADCRQEQHPLLNTQTNTPSYYPGFN